MAQHDSGRTDARPPSLWVCDLAARQSPTLRELLEAARPATPSATVGKRRRSKWLRLLASMATRGPLIGPMDDLPRRQPFRSNSADPGEAASVAAEGLLLKRPANVLALQRSGTASQALTFVVFREQPEADWVTGPAVFPVELDPDWLAPGESVAGTIELFLGLPQDDEPLTVNRHPITVMLAAAAEYQLSVVEVQLPVPPPTSAYRLLLGTRADSLA